MHFAKSNIPPKKYLLKIKIFGIKRNTSYDMKEKEIRGVCLEYFEDSVVDNITLFAAA